MVDNVRLNDRVKRVMDKAIEFVNINNLSLYIYKSMDFPYMKTIVDELSKYMNDYAHINTRHVIRLKTYRKNTRLIMFTLLLNDKGINDILCQYENLNNFIKTNFNDVEILQIKLNCQYTEYHEFLSNVRTSIKNYLEDRYNNRLEGIDSNE